MTYTQLLGLGLGWSLSACAVGLFTVGNTRWQRIATSNLMLGYVLMFGALVLLLR